MKNTRETLRYHSNLTTLIVVLALLWMVAPTACDKFVSGVPQCQAGP